MKKKSLIIAVILLLIDFISKLIININFKLLESTTVISNFFSITKVYNSGASWSILTGSRWLLVILAIIILIVLYQYQNKFFKNTRNTVTFGLLYGGIIGNLIDRIVYGYVIDFFDFNIFGYNYPVFNFADIFIVLGVVLLVIAIIKKEDINENSSR